MTEVTTDFAISYLVDDCDDCPENKDGECMTQSHCFEVKQMAIKALRMMGVLEKIRAEIKEQYGGCGLINDGLDMALSIIDKYMAESEE